uniref:Agenet domain-containing protein n=1 Tax=Leersia perrieri TaxID=77586 RepID=A0A0D9XT41_9ORYZ
MAAGAVAGNGNGIGIGRSPPPGRRRRGGRRGRHWSRPPKPSSTSPDPNDSTLSPSLPPPMEPGAEVEVRVDADGFHGSWFEATVESFLPARGPRTPARYTASYAHLVDDDDGGALVEPFAPSHLRPRPPPISDDLLLRTHQIVEAFHKDGWWSGIVFPNSSSGAAAAGEESNPGGGITVAFPITREVITFPPRLVRPRRDYVAGVGWVPSDYVIALQPSRAVRVYEVGDKVEVERDRDVYGYSWFPAKVAKVIDKLSYIVEYSTDLEGDGDGDGDAAAAAGKSVEYLHWRFIRPAEEHTPRGVDFHLGPGTAVEAYCDGAWSPGVVRTVVGEGEYEVSVAGKNHKELLLTKVTELLKPQYKWNGKSWRIVSAKRYLRRQSVSGNSPSSPVDVFSSDDEHRHETELSALKRSRKEMKALQQLENVLTEDSDHASRSEMNTPLSELCKSSGSNSSLKPCSQLSGTKNFQVLSKKIVSNCLVPVRMLDVSSGNPIPQNESREDGIGKTVVNQEIVSDMMLTNGQLDTSCGTNADEGCAMLSTTKFRKQKMTLSCRYNPLQKASFQELQTKKTMPFKIKRGKVRPIQALLGRSDTSDDINLKRNSTSPSTEIICALRVSSECNTPSPLGKPINAVDVMSRRVDSGSYTRVFTSKKLATKKRFKESESPGNLLDANSTVQPIGRKKAAGRLKGSSVERQLEGETHTQQQLDKTLDDSLNANEVIYQELLPLTPPGFESVVSGKLQQFSNDSFSVGSCDWNTDGLSESNIHSSLFDEELAATINGICLDNHNGDAQTDNVATQVAENSRLMEKPILSLDRSVEQEVGEDVGQGPIQVHTKKGASFQSTSDSTIVRGCSFAGSSMASDMSMCQVSGEQLPFTKTLALWSLVEAMDLFQKVPQQPHFLPLKRQLPPLREGIALGLMLSYSNFVDVMRKLCITDSMETFEVNIKTLATLKENGFNVEALQHSMTKLLQIKSDHTSLVSVSEKMEEEILDKASAVTRDDALLDEKDSAISKLEEELGRLRWEARKIAKNKENNEAELSRLKEENSNAQETRGQAEEQFRNVQAELRRCYAIGSQ